VERTIVDPWPFTITSGQALDIDTTAKLPAKVAEEIMALIS
jgi:hypothetical protein